MIERLAYALVGGFLGAVISLGAFYYAVDKTPWLIIGTIAAVCALLSAVLKDTMIDLLKSLWDWH